MKFITQKQIEENNYYESSYWGAGFEPGGDVCDQSLNDKEVWGSGFVGITNTGYVVFADEASYRLHRANLDEVAVENPEEKQKRMAVIARWKRALMGRSGYAPSEINNPELKTPKMAEYGGVTGYVVYFVEDIPPLKGVSLEEVEGMGEVEWDYFKNKGFFRK